MNSRPWEGAAEPVPVPYLRAAQFSPDGGTLAFVYAGDIWFVHPGGGEARLVVAHPGYNDRPRFSPDGRQLAFTSRRSGNGDIYLLDLSAGETRQLTWHDGPDVLEAWSPDGRWLWFGSGRGGRGMALYQIPVKGGTPLPLLEEPFEAFYNLSVSPDGRYLAFNNNGDAWWRRGPNPGGASQIWVVDAAHADRQFRLVVNEPCRNLWPLWSPDGRSLIFVSDRDGAENLWQQPVDGGDPTQLTRLKGGRLLRPDVSPDGRTVVFERDFGLWRSDLRTGGCEPIEIRIHPDPSPTPVTHFRQGDRLSELALSPDGQKVVFAVHGKLFADFADKKDRPRNDSFRVSDTDARESQADWSPDSRKVAYLSDRSGENQLYLYDFVTREERQLTDAPEPKYAPKFSPDGKLIAFFQRPDEIRLLDVGTGQNRPFIRARFLFALPGHSSLAWSPDNRWIAFIAQDERFFSNVYVQRVQTTEGEQTPSNGETASPVTFLSNIDAEEVLWAPDGRFLVYTTGHHRVESQVARVDLRPPLPEFREEEFAKLFEAPATESTRRSPSDVGTRDTEKSEEAEQADEEGEKPGEGEKRSGTDVSEPAKAPDPVEIQFEGLRDRLRFLTPISLHCTGLSISPDGKQLIYLAQIDGKANLWSRSLEEAKEDEPAAQLTSTRGGKGWVEFTPDSKRIYYLDDGRIQWRELPKGEPKPLEVTADFDVDFHREKRQMFREAWSLMRDHFYDPEFHGADWSGLYDRFLPPVLGAQRREEIHELLNLMVGELRASHLGAGAADEGSRDGYLGVRFDPVLQADAGHLRVTEVMPGGPSAVVREPVRVGEYLVAVDGETVEEWFNLAHRLRHRVGKRVVLHMNDRPELERAREVAVRPADAGVHDWLSYREWVRRNTEYVDRESGGRLGYVHIRAMSFQYYAQLLVDLDAQQHGKEGVLVDVRFNPGGYVAPFILDLLLRRSYDRSVFRGEVATSSVNLAGGRILDRPTIVLTNEHSGSNAEMFSEGYRALGLGKVVGRPSAGAVIWTWGWQLLDGSWFRLPRIAVQSLSGENLEGAARPVDYDVDRPLGEWERGRDRQLDEAIRRLLEQIDGR
jgi:Tol biopolymer transport system component/C-terminal processing protease CtpA/Prc